jgi:uncharacterized lipoprotein YajG
MKNMRVGRLCILAITLFLAGGCATSRSIVDIRVVPGADPINGKPVKIIRVTDSRKFEVAPRTQSIPSLSEEEIKDAGTTSRAIGRKRNTYGKALGDFLLPEQRTVQDLIREAITKALREKGYSVVEQSSAAYQGALPLEADITQLWAYMTPGFWSLTLESETVVTVNGEVFPASGEEKVKGYGRMSAQAAFESNYVEVVQDAIEDFVKNLKEKLKSPTSE